MTRSDARNDKEKLLTKSIWCSDKDPASRDDAPSIDRCQNTWAKLHDDKENQIRKFWYFFCQFMTTSTKTLSWYKDRSAQIAIRKISIIIQTYPWKWLNQSWNDHKLEPVGKQHGWHNCNLSKLLEQWHVVLSKQNKLFVCWQMPSSEYKRQINGLVIMHKDVPTLKGSSFILYNEEAIQR